MRNLIIIALFATLTAGCGEEETSDNGGTHQGANQDGGGNGGGNGGGSGDNSGGSASIDWTGTWTMRVDYDVYCDWGGANEGSASHSGTWAMKLQGDNDDLSVSLESGWFVLEGSGDDDGFMLSGTFPFESYYDEALSGNSNNNIFIDGYDVVSADEVYGEISGSFEDGQGWDCELTYAEFVMTR
jgi:hypothetical protein